MLTFRRLHQLDQNSAHVLGMHEDHRDAVSADARLARAQHRRALRPHRVAGGVDVLHLEADVMLPAPRVLLKEGLERGLVAIGLDQLDLAVGQVDEGDPDPLLRKRACR